ncbi:MAG TPA: sialidase family protein, partial [Thermoplasmata archaeon]|nr:sialidase family protein [Thermoplasmata archaeon]
MLPPIPTGGTRLAAPDPTPLDAPFGPNVRASENAVLGNQNEITMAVASDGRIHMGWNDLQSTNPDYRCGYAYSTDGGATWSANRLFHMPPYDADGDPVVVVDSNNVVYFICMAFYRSGGSEVISYRSADGGVTFAPGVVVSDTTNGFNDKPWAHAVGTTVYACWTNFVGGGTEFRYTFSADGGATWAPSRVLDYNGQGCTFAHNDAGNLYAAWQRGNNIYAFRSLDGGGTWGTGAHFVGGAPFTDSPNQRAYNMPSLAANRATSGVYAVWTANDGAGGWDVRFSGSTDGAITWSSPVVVNDVRTGHQFMPSIGVDVGGTLHVAWYDDRSGLMAVRYASSSNGGSSWLASLRVTDMEGPTTYFLGDYITLVADATSHVNVGWADYRSGENEAYFARSSLAGPPRLARIDVTPSEAWTDADTAVTFTASGFNQYGQLFPINPNWQATGGSIASGSYFPDAMGDWQVWANESGVSGTAVVHVAPGALARIEVVPADATISADDSQLYGAMGFDAHGNPRTITP